MTQPDQGTFLRAAMKELRLTRAAFATRFSLSRRALDTWLLPVKSSGYRRMDDKLLMSLREELAYIREDRHGLQNSGVLDPSVPAVSIEGTRFPTIYESFTRYPIFKTEVSSYMGLDGRPTQGPVKIVTREREPESGGVFGFSGEVPEGDIAINCLRRAPVHHLDEVAHRHLWVFVNRHRTPREARSYLQAAFHGSDIYTGNETAVEYGVCEFDNAFYTLLARTTPAGRPGGLMIYEMEKLVDHEIYGELLITEQGVMLPSGEFVTESDRIEELLYAREEDSGVPILDPEGVFQLGTTGRVG